MRTGYLISYLLTLVLLCQAAAAHAAIPCMMEQAGKHDEMQRMAEKADQSSGHQHVAMSHGDHSRPESAGSHDADMPCCDESNGATCITGGCLSIGSLLTAPELSLQQRSGRASKPQQLSWLRSYGAPASLIYRPPIA